MSLINVIFDHKLKQSDIIVPLQNSSKDEAGDVYTKNQPEIQQTSILGIQSPLIMINKIVVDFTDVVDFELDCTGILPSVSLIARDRKKLTESFDTPGIDNELRIQILPKFEDKYKKINLTFYITSMDIENGFITIRASYKVPKLTQSNIKALGEINTYKLFELVANETDMGFATNICENDADKRWIYCNNKSYIDLLSDEIRRSGSDLQICDFWVDWWNNIVLADIYERYNTIDKDEDMQIWIAGRNDAAGEGVEVAPQQVIASLHNHPANSNSELHIANYSKITNSGSQMSQGTDRVYSTYEMDKTEYMDYLVQDGDTKKDIFQNFEYLGEVYGGFNYLLQGKKRESFLQKISTNETIEISLKTPLLGLMRGNHVNILWYYNDSRVDAIKKKLDTNGGTEPITPNIPINDMDGSDDGTDAGQFMMDKTISGQYLITGCKMMYDESGWDYRLTLSRSSNNKQNILKNE